ncbi:carotenoid ester lipase precursor [Cubamyces sp. BRFM 1775]|nr:carotenoid ester lipase precursor [Cubamyces sp. BRFM 1775]
MRRPSRIAWSSFALAIASVSASANPTITLDEATIIGVSNNSVTSFYAIPFAEPPINDLRLRLPKPITSYNGTINATLPATQCLQLVPGLRSDLPADIVQVMAGYFAADFATSDIPQSEDCLSISVQVPDGTSHGDKLPVLVQFFGGGFTFGSTAQTPGDAIVRRSVEMGKPIVYANMNYRVGALGFLGGKEVKEAGVGNLGLQDQRTALRWVQKYISIFGGDPDKVTLWGESAGAISIGLQMVANDGDNEGLFRGAIMNSGSPLPTGDIELQQSSYDTVVEHAGCAEADDTLECLRGVPADTLMAAAAAVPNLFDYSGLAEVWAPRADGVFLEAPPQHLVLAGKVAHVPFISGDCLDEGTIFATGSFNVTTDAEFEGFIHDHFFSTTLKALLAPLFELYPNDPAAGSPFGTGDANQLAPQFKRMAAIQGDLVFQAPRRFFLDQRSLKQPTWSFMSERAGVTGLGYPHGSDFAPVLMGDDLTDYVIQFTATLNPNGASNRTIEWPQYDPINRSILRLVDGDEPLKIGRDTDRLEAMAGLTAYSIAQPF